MIRDLHPETDLALVAEFLAEAADYWIMAEGAAPGPDAARDFFTDGPPNRDPVQSHHLGLFHDGHLSGLAELSFGFPNAGDAYLGLMILAPRIRSLGLGPGLLAHVESLARAAKAPNLYLGVLQANTRGRAFWDRHGFHPTGLCRDDGRHIIHRLVKPL